MKASEIVVFILLALFLLTSSSAGSAQSDRTISPAQSARALRGKALFVKAGCWGCHARGENSLNQDRPLKGLGFKKRYPKDDMIALQVRSGSPRRGMPAFSKDKLCDRDLSDIIFYIRGLDGSNFSVTPSTVRK